MKKILISLFVMAVISSAGAITLGEMRNIYMKGIQALANNEMLDAERSFKTIISLPANDNKTYIKYQAKSYYFLGDVYFVQRDFDKAIASYRKVVQDYREEDVYSRAMYKLGRTFILAQKYREGIALLNSYVGSYDNRDALGDNSLYWIGRAYIGMKDYRLAMDTYKMVLDKYPNTALAYDIRSSLPQLEELLQDQENQANRISGMTNQLQVLQEQNSKLKLEKQTLEKMSELLVIKQRLLEIKAQKVDILANIKENRENKK